MIKTIKIPHERLPVLIGKNGVIKRQIEKQTKTKILIEEEVIIEGDSLNVLTAENIVKAIGRGFSPVKAKILLKEETSLAIMELPKNENTQKRLKARLIGTSGKCRRNIERLTGTQISVYGKTVSIIGGYDNVDLAEQGVSKIIKGMSHRFVYKFLEGKKNG